MRAIATEDDKKRFALHLKAWQIKLNLSNWRVTVSGKSAGKKAMASVSADVPNHLATVRLGDIDWEGADDEVMESTAVHELLHVLLAPLIEAAKHQDTPEEALAAAEHSIITVIEALLVPQKGYNNVNAKAK